MVRAGSEHLIKITLYTPTYGVVPLPPLSSLLSFFAFLVQWTDSGHKQNKINGRQVTYLLLGVQTEYRMIQHISHITGVRCHINNLTTSPPGIIYT